VPIAEVRGVLQQALDRAKALDPQINLEVIEADVKNSFMVSPSARIVTALKAAWESTLKKEAKLVGGSWLGDTASFGHLCSSAPCSLPGRPFRCSSQLS